MIKWKTNYKPILQLQEFSYRKQIARKLRTQDDESIYNKCIEDDTKITACRSPNCIRNTKK